MANKWLIIVRMQQMKSAEKLLADCAWTGAMALTLFTACGSNAVTEKDIADVMSDMAKAEAEGTNVTFTPRAKEREMAQKTCCTARESFGER